MENNVQIHLNSANKLFQHKDLELFEYNDTVTVVPRLKNNRYQKKKLWIIIGETNYDLCTDDFEIL